MRNTTTDQKIRSVAEMPLKFPVRVHRQTVENYEKQRGWPGWGKFMAERGNIVIIEDEEPKTRGQDL